MSERSWRVVRTGHDRDGRAVFVEDRSSDSSLLCVLALAGRPRTPADGADTSEWVAAPGAAKVDAIRLASDEHLVSDAADVFDALVVVRGEVVAAFGSADAVVRPGDVIVPRGQAYEIRAPSEARILRVRAVADPSVEPTVATSLGTDAPAQRVRRVVAGRGGIAHDGEPALSMVVGDADAPVAALVDVWELGGPLAAADQGGDAPGPYQLEPRAGGMKVSDVELAAAPEGTPPREGGWHATATIDVDVVVRGTVDMFLPDLPPVRLEAGDILVQHGTNHLWHPVGSRSLRMSTVMFGMRDA